MKKVIKEQVYISVLSKGLLDKIDFSDTISTTNHTNTIVEISNLIFNTMPTWIAVLFKIRNALVSLIGLKTTMPKNYSIAYKVGGYIGFFKIYALQYNEIVLGTDDKHLNFRVTISKTKDKFYNVKVTTLVSYNNRLGAVYMKLISPFHVLTVKRMVKQAYKCS